MNKRLKYKVDIDLANETKKEMAKSLETDNKRVLNKMGAFASLYDINFKEYPHPVLVLKTEEPGSKQLIAARYKKLEGIAYDMINHLVNDCIVMGAHPLSVQDAIICGKMNKENIKELVKSIADACRAQDCLLTGGETSEQPGVIDENTYILTSSIVGIVDKNSIIDGSKIKKGDIILGCESSGIHTNGYTLVRQIMESHPQILDMKIGDKSFIDAILVPHRCYYQALKDLFDKQIISGLAHITGGGICENLNRILPSKYDAQIDASKYRVLEIFKVLKNIGNISDEQMIRTFNLGVGLAIITKKRNAQQIISHIENKGIKCFEIGKIIDGNQKVIITNKFSWL